MTIETEEEVLAQLSVGHRVWFEEEVRPYTVQARSANFIVCTKPFAVKKTVLYTIIDVRKRIRGPENLIFGMGAETREECREMVLRLEGKCPGTDFVTEVSHRNNTPLKIRKTAS